MTKLLPGDVGLGRNNTLGGWAIRIGDGVWSKRNHVEAQPYNHAVLAIGDGRIIQAEPSGAQIVGVVPSRFDWYRHPDLTDAQRAAVADHGALLEGTPYNWLDIAALTLDCLGWDVQRTSGRLTWVGRRINRIDRLICSALVDKAYLDAGVHLFDDGRLQGEVTPADLARCPSLERVS